MSFKTSRPNKSQAEKVACEFRKQLNNSKNRVKVYPEVHKILFSKNEITEWIIEVV